MFFVFHFLYIQNTNCRKGIVSKVFDTYLLHVVLHILRPWMICHVSPTHSGAVLPNLRNIPPLAHTMILIHVSINSVFAIFLRLYSCVILCLHVPNTFERRLYRSNKSKKEVKKMMILTGNLPSTLLSNHVMHLNEGIYS